MEKILFQETNYSFISKNGRSNPKFDVLVTRVLFIPLVILTIFFFALNLYEWNQGNIYVPYVFQNILLLVVSIGIFVFYPRRTLIITEKEIILRNEKKILKKMPLSELQKVDIHESKRHMSILTYHVVELQGKKDTVRATVFRSQKLKNVLLRHTQTSS